MHPQLGASFQSYTLAKFYVSIATAVLEKSKLWKPTKIWAVAIYAAIDEHSKAS
jgi:hypothetical protein